MIKNLIKKFFRLLNLTRKYPFQKLSFSQCGEDLIIYFIFQNLLKINKPSYLDIGAHHPFFLSNTAHLYLNGSRGINIEPDINLFKSFIKSRKKDINLNIAVSENNEIRKFYIMSYPTLNTLSLEEAKKNEILYNIKIEKSVEIESCTMEHILKKYFNNKMPDLLTIDVEGYELEILKTLNLNIYRPKVICVEAYDIDSNVKVRREDLVQYLVDKKYKVYADTGMNVILISESL